MRAILFLAGLMASGALFAQTPAHQRMKALQADPAALQAAVAAGGKASFFCANCHGRDARGGPVGKSVLGETGEFLEKVREGEGGNNYSRRKDYMPSWSSGEITNAEVLAMVSYVRTLR